MLKGRISTLAGSAAKALPIDMQASKMMLLKKRNTVFSFICNVALLIGGQFCAHQRTFFIKGLAPPSANVLNPIGAGPDGVFLNRVLCTRVHGSTHADQSTAMPLFFPPAAGKTSHPLCVWSVNPGLCA